jgi:site-specific recombinase XerD
VSEIEPYDGGALEQRAAADVDRVLSEATRARIIDGVAANTRKAYERQMTRFTAWCAEHGRTPLPCTAETLAEYVSHLCDDGAGPSAIEQAIATIRTVHRLAGFQHQPDTELARKALRAHRRTRAEQGERKRKAPPITLDMLRAMIEASPADTLTGLRDRALLVLGWAMMGRRSELAALRIGDVAETDDGLEVTVRMSKTDQDAHGEVVPIPHGVHEDTDPVRVLRAWLAALAEHGADVGPDTRLLRSVSRWGKPAEAIDTESINRAVRAAAVRANVPNAERVTAHSLRAGGATAAYKGGAPVSVIAQHGRWSENSPVVLGYIRAVDKWTDNPMRGIGL